MLSSHANVINEDFELVSWSVGPSISQPVAKPVRAASCIGIKADGNSRYSY